MLRSNLTHAVRLRFVRLAVAVRAVCGCGSCGTLLNRPQRRVPTLSEAHVIVPQSRQLFGVELFYMLHYEIIKQIANICDYVINC